VYEDGNITTMKVNLAYRYEFQFYFNVLCKSGQKALVTCEEVVKLLSLGTVELKLLFHLLELIVLL